mgnify:CR=1 FL=1
MMPQPDAGHNCYDCADHVEHTAHWQRQWPRNGELWRDEGEGESGVGIVVALVALALYVW